LPTSKFDTTNATASASSLQKSQKLSKTQKLSSTQRAGVPPTSSKQSTTGANHCDPETDSHKSALDDKSEAIEANAETKPDRPMHDSQAPGVKSEPNGSKVHPQSESELEREPESKSEFEYEPEREPEHEHEHESESESESESEPEPEPEPEHEPEPEPEPEVARPAPEHSLAAQTIATSKSQRGHAEGKSVRPKALEPNSGIALQEPPPSGTSKAPSATTKHDKVSRCLLVRADEVQARSSLTAMLD
jgi:hypothetical protein